MQNWIGIGIWIVMGASIGLDRLMAALEEMKQPVSGEINTRLCILCLDSELIPYYHRTALWFRERGVKTEVYPEKKKFSRQFTFAEKKKIPFALICGEDEIQKNTVIIKDLNTRESHDDLSLEEALKIIQ